ncbi:hypothetical protein [Candidatus Nitrospira allomarina]|uniref:Uncharacterized protein n=1 Tax=Candidatus Nitrospira allomarina TaxID=3020900 RepID=A0AA96GLU8_9BACT|nr:hypothetical protein [Candidatus Nitrospira allomarina]WNM59936.1 hypothetical protein PP769_09315 [Candidatus Nitrospira allomarina]
MLNAADQFASTPAPQRFARLLLELGDRFGKHDETGVRMTLNLKRKDLVQMTAVTEETVVSSRG